MIKCVYGYIYDYDSGILTSLPNSLVERMIDTTTTGTGERVYLRSTKIDDHRQYRVESNEGLVYHNSNTGTYTIWFNVPNPIEAKSKIFEYIYNEAINREKTLEKELEKARQFKKEVETKFGVS